MKYPVLFRRLVGGRPLVEGIISVQALGKSKRRSVAMGLAVVIGLASVVWGGAFVVMPRPMTERFFLPREARAVELRHIREIVLRNTPAAATEPDPLRLSDLLRDAIYRHVPLKATAPEYDPSNLDWSFFRAYAVGRYGHICQGLAFTYLQALRAFGIPARYVALMRAVQGEAAPDNHASVEVLIGGQWQVSDPTFNITVLDETGRRLGWTEVRDRALKGLPVFTDSGGFPVAFDRDIASYYVSLSELARYLAFSRGAMADGWTPVHTVPESWDGIIRYPDGSSFNLIESLSTAPYDVLTE